MERRGEERVKKRNTRKSKRKEGERGRTRVRRIEQEEVIGSELKDCLRMERRGGEEGKKWRGRRGEEERKKGRSEKGRSEELGKGEGKGREGERERKEEEVVRRKVARGEIEEEAERRKEGEKEAKTTPPFTVYDFWRVTLSSTLEHETQKK